MDKYTNASCCRKGGVSGRNTNSTLTNCRTLKKRLTEVEFAITETVLYLDAYPECTEALNFYHRLIEEREMLVLSINEQCGPMTHFGNTSTDSWQWIYGPWPWKYEAN